MHSIFVINPGSTSTKVALFEDENLVFEENIAHSTDELAGYSSVIEQKERRTRLISELLDNRGYGNTRFDAIIGRGGLLHPIEGGVYEAGPDMLDDLSSCRYGEHASNLGALLATELAEKGETKSPGERDRPHVFIADPVVVDEMQKVARYSGLPRISRQSIFHALNQKAAAREVSGRLGRAYGEVSLIVAHLGGGISVGAHVNGRIIDVNDALQGDGPFSPERAGGLPAWPLLEMCRNENYSLAEMKKIVTGKGGLVAYAGTNDLRELLRRRDEGDQEAGEIFQAMIYQVSKEIAMHGATLFGDVDAIVITGGMAHNQEFIDGISKRVSYLAPIEVVPGERELHSLAENALLALRGEVAIKQYSK
ncbi:MAG: butyrate kinase [Spirochaetales bacterium]|nr:butyrate kinase [Spirochaetales bacterium]MCF7939171.1 butyrate kinase [Spirochaetales bacterium]